MLSYAATTGSIVTRDNDDNSDSTTLQSGLLFTPTKQLNGIIGITSSNTLGHSRAFAIHKHWLIIKNSGNNKQTPSK